MSSVSYEEIGTAAHIKRELVEAVNRQARQGPRDMGSIPIDRIEAIFTVGKQLRAIQQMPGWRVLEQIAVDCMRVGDLMLADDKDLPTARVRARSIAEFLAKIEASVLEGERANDFLQKKDQKAQTASANPDELIDPRTKVIGK
uniref:Terminase n=1 Tax=viral metagenome TaxID=1070528 RepID=A0A6M3XKK1_9ZZZZ